MMIVQEQDLPEPLWMVAAVDQRLAQIDDHISTVIEALGIDVVMSHLSDVDNESDESIERWQHSCDHCGMDCGSRIITGQAERQHNGRTVIITFGGCAECLGLA